MTRDELATEIMLLRPIITNVLGFDQLAEQEEFPLKPVKRAMYEAYVYAGGVELAIRLNRLLHDMEEEG